MNCNPASHNGRHATDAVLVNTAIAVAGDPDPMAVAFKLAVAAGRLAYEVGLAAEQFNASATSPLTGFLEQGVRGASPRR